MIVPLFFSQYSRLLRFICVGGAAACVHFTVGLILTQYVLLNPMISNIGAFCVAFAVSYFGQSRWTFTSDEPKDRREIFRFAATSLLGLLINQGILYIGLYAFYWLYPAALFLAIAGAAVSTYLVSSFWVFRT